MKGTIMKRNIIWLLVAMLVGFIGYDLGQREVDGFEFTVTVSDSGVQLVSAEGSRWGSATYRGEDPRSFSFIVDELGVRSPEVVR
jgi:hypothetical protein